jgi:hypothetical protein
MLKNPKFFSLKHAACAEPICDGVYGFFRNEPKDRSSLVESIRASWGLDQVVFSLFILFKTYIFLYYLYLYLYLYLYYL